MSEEPRNIVFIRNDIADLVDMLDEMGPVLTAEEIMQIDEHAYLIILPADIAEHPLTVTCQEGSFLHEEMKKDPRYAEREYVF